MKKRMYIPVLLVLLLAALPELALAAGPSAEETGLRRIYGFGTSSDAQADRVVTLDSIQLELRRTYGSSAASSVQAEGAACPIMGNSAPLWMGRTYGSSAIASAQAARKVPPPSSAPLWMGRTYGFE